MLKPPIIWILDVCHDWFLNTGALWPNCKRYWRIIFFLHEFSMSKRSSVLIFALYIRWKSLSKYLWRRKLQRYAFFFFTVKTVLSTVDKNEDKTMPASFQVQEFLYVQSIVWILVSSFITIINWVWRFGHTKLTFKFMNSWMCSL